MLDYKTDVVTLYHGNRDVDMKPFFGACVPYNDYGSGFYTTPSIELAREWAYSAYTQGETGYLHAYTIDLRSLNVLDFTELDSLCWVAELMHNRHVNLQTDLVQADLSVLKDNMEMLEKQYRVPNIDAYDVIVGYRADDSYFSYAVDFVQGTLYRETLDSALRFGDLGLQVCIKSRKAFAALKPVAGSPTVVPIAYSDKWKSRDTRARKLYLQHKHTKGKTLIRDYLKSEED